MIRIGVEARYDNAGLFWPVFYIYNYIGNPFLSSDMRLFFQIHSVDKNQGNCLRRANKC